MYYVSPPYDLEIDPERMYKYREYVHAVKKPKGTWNNRMLCELLNTGNNFYMLNFRSPNMAYEYRWVSFKQAQPLDLGYRNSKKLGLACLEKREQLKIRSHGHHSGVLKLEVIFAARHGLLLRILIKLLPCEVVRIDTTTVSASVGHIVFSRFILV